MIINTDKINKLKRHKVVRGLNFIDAINHGFDEPLIEKVILFGSSITEDCHEDSDVDICLVSKYDCTHMGFFTIFGKLPIVMDELCDIVVYSNLKGSLKSEIDRKGITVYESR